jgi:hypothetical protein
MTFTPPKSAGDRRREATVAKLKAQLEALDAEARQRLNLSPERDLTPSNRPTTLRKWSHTYHFAANEPSDSHMLKLMQYTPDPRFFDVVEWLKNVAQSGHRITVSMTQRLP